MTDPAILARNFIEAVVGGYPDVEEVVRLVTRVHGSVLYQVICSDGERYEIECRFLPEKEEA